MIEAAVIGAGRIVRIHAANVAAQSGIRLKYVADVHEESARELAQRHGARVADVEGILGDPSVASEVAGDAAFTAIFGLLGCGAILFNIFRAARAEQKAATGTPEVPPTA